MATRHKIESPQGKGNRQTQIPAILHVGRNSSFFLLNFSLLVAEAPRKEGRKKEEGKMLLLSSKLRIAAQIQPER
jgi:hypothetical protein